MKKWIWGLALVVAVLFMIAPAYGLITKDNAKQIASGYQYSDELIEIYGPYTISNQPYYFADYYPREDDGQTTGALIIDAETGEIVKDTGIINKMIMMHSWFAPISSDRIDDLEMASAYYQICIEFMEEDIEITEESSEVMKQKNYSKNIKVSRQIQNYSNDLKKNTDRKIIVCKKIVSGEYSYENALELKNLTEDYISLLEDYLIAREEYRVQSVLYYDMGNTVGYNSDRYSWEKSRENYLAGLDLDTEIIQEELDIEMQNKELKETYVAFTAESIPIRTADSETPGFGIAVAVSALLVAGMFMRNRRK